MSADPIYIHPDAAAALHNVYMAANLKPVIVQTEGGTPASAGTHLSEGTYTDSNGVRRTYTGCIDFSVNQPATRLSDGKKMAMDEPHINWFLEKLSEFGFAGWHRTPSEGFDASHIHVVCSMVPITLPIVQQQVIDFVNGRSGLKGHGDEIYWTASDANDAVVADVFAKANPDQAYRLPS